ncbi:hypothetical protein G6F24_017997 [Rhizopus arrhizus]|nr:hypothetical protein G6F24_017997 [Rhizopus arrhizus]
MSALQRALAGADPQAHIEAVAPNLEDVIVASTRGRAAPAAPRPHHAGDDRRHSGDAVAAVRLCDQPQPAPS